MFTWFNWLDGACNLMPAALRVGLYGLISGILAMLLYWRISPQSRIRELKAQISQAQLALRTYDGANLRQMMHLSWQAVSPAARQVLLVGAPTLVAAIPVLLLMAWLESSYSYRLPNPENLVTVTTMQTPPIARPLGWVPAEIVAQTLPHGQYVVRWPANGSSARLIDVTSKLDLLGLPLDRPIRTFRQARWWHRFLEGSSGGYLPADGPLSTVEIDLPRRLIWPSGPPWLCSWHATFMLALTAGALAAKFRFKIA